MNQVISFPAVIKTELLSIATDSQYPQAMEILQRGENNQLILNSKQEAQAIMNIAKLKLLDTELKNPYWDDSEDSYNQIHEENFQEVQMGLFEKTISYISASDYS